MIHDARDSWRGRRVLVTGHTGFKGGWLCRALHLAGAEVFGLSADVPTTPSFYELAHVRACLRADIRGDVRCEMDVRDAFERARPDVVFHLAAQSLVRPSYDAPVETFETNVMGTIRVLEQVRRRALPCALVVVTSDKCYRPARAAHREDAALGGDDPYSASKAAAELATHAWRQSFAPASEVDRHGIAIASVRAGNVFGGGDFAADRLVPDMARAFRAGAPVRLRHPSATRPWQHVLEPVRGYLMLADALCGPEAWRYCSAWNFGPALDDVCSVASFANRFTSALGAEAWARQPVDATRPECEALSIDATKAERFLGWSPRWTLALGIEAAADWYRAAFDGGVDLAAFSDAQLRAHLDWGAGPAANEDSWAA